MPRPPVLETIEWCKVFDSGQPFDAWLADAENAEHREKMTSAVARLEGAHDVGLACTAIGQAVHVVAIAEDWCGDVVRHVPVLEMLARACPKIQVRYVTRAQHKNVFARFLTNGGEAIPKFIFLSEDFVECANWGPMPEACRRLIARGKACGKAGEAREKVSANYNADPDCFKALEEILTCVETAAATAP